MKNLAVERSRFVPAAFLLASNAAWGLLRGSSDRIAGRVAFGETRKPAFTRTQGLRGFRES